MVTQQTLAGLGLAVDRLAGAKANPNNNKNDLLIWYLINLFIVGIFVTIIVDSVLLNWLNWFLEFVTTKYLNQILLFTLVIIIDLLIMFVTKNSNVINGGFFAVITYYLVDYFYLVNEWTDFSLMNLIS